MTRFLSTGLRVITVAALTSGLTLSAMAQTAGSQPNQSGVQAPAKTAPAVEVKKDAMPAATVKGADVKATQPAAGAPTQATGTQAAKPATTVTTSAKPATTTAPAPAMQHDGKVTVTPEKKTGG